MPPYQQPEEKAREQNAILNDLLVVSELGGFPLSFFNDHRSRILNCL